MSSPPQLLGSSQSMNPTPPRGFLMTPGMRALQTGLKHAMLADNVLETLGLYPNKRQKMPPVGKQSRKGNYKKKTAYKKKASPTSVVKKAILSMAQSYHTGIPDSILTVSTVSNTIYTYNITAQTTQGTALSQRQGDQIYLISCKLKGSIFTPTTAGAYQFRVMVLMSGEEFNPGLMSSAGLSAGELFLPNTAGTFNVHGQVNTKAITILYDQRIDINSTITGVSDVAAIDLNIPLLRKFEYQATGSVYGKKQNLYAVVTSVVGGGTSGTTATGQILMSADLLFKNL